MSHQDIDLATLLRHKGYRMTTQRQMVLDAVCGASGHATPEQVYERVQQMSEAVNRATVYRTLKFLREMGLITATTSGDGHLEYEIASASPHHHLICWRCGADIEFPDELFSGFVDRLEERYGFDIETTHVTLTGRCRSCRGGA